VSETHLGMRLKMSGRIVAEVEALENKARFGLTFIEIALFGGIALVFLAGVLTHYTHWEARTCFIIAAIPTLTTQNLFTKLPPRKKIFREVQILVVLAIVYSA
jgi:hypothetical protein